jgi:hypothetical protein
MRRAGASTGPVRRVQWPCLAVLGLACGLFAARAPAADPRAAASTINHAFATELGTGFYDVGGRSVFILSFAPAFELRAATDSRAGLRLVIPMAGGSFDFKPDDALGGNLPDRVDSFSVMPGFEFDLPLQDDWILRPWARAGASFAEGTSDGLLYGAGARLVRDLKRGDRLIAQLHELGLVNVNYRNLPDDSFLRLRNAVDIRRPTLSLGSGRRLLTGLYGILDLVPDPPATPTGVKPSALQLEAGITFNGDPRPRLGPLRWPRLGFGYRFAGDFSGWRIVIGAPF